jgi:hypothetical protein
VCAKTIWLLLLLGKLPANSAVTYNGEVAAVLEKHCVKCHREGEVGPFALDTYEAARKHARQVALAARVRFMPPYKPVAPSLAFHQQRRLSEAEIVVLEQWAATGTARGVDQGRPERPMPPDEWPALSWKMGEPYALKADGDDEYRCFVVATGAKEAQWVNGFQFRAGNRKVVHHALFFFDVSGAARRLDAAAEGPGYPCFGSPGFLPTSSLGGWSPGNERLQMPPGTAVRMPANADLVMQIHYHPTGKPETDQSELGVFLAGPPTKKLLDIPLTSNQIDIAPGVASYKVTDSFELPVDVTLWQIIPHAHFVARQVRAWAVTDKGVRTTVLTIKDWDFNWQDIYQLKQPLQLKAGTRLHMEIVYDNSTANPRNPNRPPKRVVWGPGTADEMAGVHWNVTVDDEERDMADLTHSLWGKMMRAIRRR